MDLPRPLLNREDPVVITGGGLVSAIGLSAMETWKALLEGACGIRPIEGFDATGFPCPPLRAAQTRIDPEQDDLYPRWPRLTGLHTHLLSRATREAIAQARLDRASLPGDAIGFFVGMGMVDYRVDDLLPSVQSSLASLGGEGALDLERFYSGAYREIHPLWPLSMLNNISFCLVASQWDIRGENTVFSPHADSGAQALIEGVRTLHERKARVVLAGGVGEPVSPLSLARALLLGMLAPAAEDELAPCRPFSTERGGTVLGEGCGMAALELRSHADARGASYPAMISGYGFAFETERGGEGPTASAIARAMRETLRCADLAPEAIDVVIAHGDGTVRGDRNEMDAIRQMFAACLNRIRVYGSKGALGHLLAAAPAVDLLIGAEMIREGIIPPALPLADEAGDLGLPHIRREPTRARIDKVLVNCRNQEGQCVSLLLEKI
jgi:3-oxoacyl-[acyl-carrier-protein] synthase II